MELDKLREIITIVMDPDRPERFKDITEKTSLDDDLGADSLNKFEIILMIEDEFGIEIHGSDMSEYKTVGQLMQRIKQSA